MPRQRRFLKMSDKEQIMYLIHYLGNAMREHPEISGSSYALRHRTDVVGIAKQYGGLFKIKREDYEKIKGLTVGEIIDIFNEGFIIKK